MKTYTTRNRIKKSITEIFALLNNKKNIINYHLYNFTLWWLIVNIYIINILVNSKFYLFCECGVRFFYLFFYEVNSLNNFFYIYRLT